MANKNLLRELPISRRQQQVLDLMIKYHGASMDATIENYRQISGAIGWKQYGAVRDCLFSLRHKGAIKSEGPSNIDVDRWIISLADP